jgi:predicted RNase H-like HicB family nuclease
MERRQVQEVGGGTVTVSLPHDWAESHDVTPGTAVFLRPQADGVLELSPDPSEVDPLGTARIELHAVGPAATAQRLRTAYRQGFSTVELTRDEFADEHRSAVQRQIRKLPGATITTQEDGSITVAVPMDPEAVSVGQTVRSLVEAITTVFRQLHASLGTDPVSEPSVTPTTIQRKADLLARQTSRPFDQPPTPVDRTQYRGLGNALAAAGTSGLRALQRRSSPEAPDERVQQHLDTGIELLEAAGRVAVDGSTEPSPAQLLDRCASLERAIEEAIATDPTPQLVAHLDALERLVTAARKASEVAAVRQFDVAAAE